MNFNADSYCCTFIDIKLEANTDNINLEADTDNIKLEANVDGSECGKDVLLIPIKKIKKGRKRPTAKAKKNEESNFSCNKCPEMFLSSRALLLHSLRHFKASGVKFACAICQWMFKTNDDLIDHKSVHENEDLCFTCKKCKKGFSHHRKYLFHGLKHLKTKIFKCIECPCTYKLKRSFKEHIATHYDRKLKCMQCDQSFKQAKDLKTHRRNRHKAGIQCVECGKNCLTKRDHIEHMVSHTGVKIYQCIYCGKGFSRINARRIHTRKNHMNNSHIKKELYECNVCHVSYYCRSRLSKHFRTKFHRNNSYTAAVKNDANIIHN